MKATDFRECDPQSRCEKCGAFGERTVVYHEDRIKPHMGDGECWLGICIDVPEHLCVQCNVCGYRWVERCFDANPPPECFGYRKDTGLFTGCLGENCPVCKGKGHL